MNCSLAEGLFERFLDGEVSRTERARLLAHVDGCANCRAVLDELRVVDALLLAPRTVELAPNFTFATMAQARAVPPPVPHRAPIRAYLVSYVVAAWMVAGAALWLQPRIMHALTGTLADLMRSVADAIGGLGLVISRMLGHDTSTIAAILASLVALDVTLVVTFGAALRFARPRLLERVRS